MTIKFDEYGGKAVELPATLFSDYAVQHQPLVEAIYENEPVDDVANRNAVGRMHQRNYIAIHVRGEPAVNKR